MRADWRRILKAAFEAPPPVEKEKFLREIERLQPKISHFDFVVSQISYIRKRIWILSAAVFMCAVYGAFWARDTFWILCALIPFLAVSAVTENRRSMDYGMAEMEMVSRFSLKSVIFARMEILGIVHGFLLMILIPLASLHSVFSWFETGMYVFTPYLLAAALGLEITRRMHGREADYAGLGAALGVSVFYGIFSVTAMEDYGEDALFRWSAGVALLAVWTVRGYRKLIRETEEMTWKLS